MGRFSTNDRGAGQGLSNFSDPLVNSPESDGSGGFCSWWEAACDGRRSAPSVCGLHHLLTPGAGKSTIVLGFGQASELPGRNGCAGQIPNRWCRTRRLPEKTPLKGMRFESLAEAQAYLDHWEERWADTRIHGTTKRQVAAMFAEEKPSLLPLPVEPFRYYQYGERVVHLDGCVEVEAAYYGLPPGWIGRSVKVQWDALHVRILHPGTNQLLREHLRQKRGWYRIKNEDHPKKMPFSTAQLLRRAGHAGTQVGVLCVAIYQRQGEVGIRRILGILSLAKKYGTAALEDACAVALEIGGPDSRFRRRYLARP